MVKRLAWSARNAVMLGNVNVPGVVEILFEFARRSSPPSLTVCFPCIQLSVSDKTAVVSPRREMALLPNTQPPVTVIWGSPIGVVTPSLMKYFVGLS